MTMESDLIGWAAMLVFTAALGMAIAGAAGATNLIEIGVAIIVAGVGLTFLLGLVVKVAER